MSWKWGNAADWAVTTAEKRKHYKKHGVSATYGKESPFLLYDKINGGHEEPTLLAATYWKAHKDDYIALVEATHDSVVLLSFGVPLDLIAENVPTAIKKMLPWWQSGEKEPDKHVCTMKLVEIEWNDKPIIPLQFDPVHGLKSDPKSLLYGCASCDLQLTIPV